jgi:hypothetical protein
MISSVSAQLRIQYIACARWSGSRQCHERGDHPPAGTDNQTFCYDAQNRLTWAASASATGPCANNTAGTLSGGSIQYTQSFAYDVLDRLTSGAGGSYTYGVWSQRLHAVTAIGSAYTASYDASGAMLCRAPTSSTTCSGTPTGAQLTYDVEGRLSAWQTCCRTPPRRRWMACRGGPGVRQCAWTLACAHGAAAIRRSVPALGAERARSLWTPSHF